MTYNGTPTKYHEPRTAQKPGTGSAVVNGRWRWWYSAIADLMIRHPEWKMTDIARELNKHPNTVSMIVNTDLFKEYLAQRKVAWAQEHDHAIRAKLTDVVSESLDIVLEQLKTKKSQIGLQAALKVTESALDRLGYAPQSQPQVVVNNAPDNRQQTIVAVTPMDLEAARDAMRKAEQAKTGTSLGGPPLLEACGAGPEAGSGIEAIEAELLP